MDTLLQLVHTLQLLTMSILDGLKSFSTVVLTARILAAFSLPTAITISLCVVCILMKLTFNKNSFLDLTSYDTAMALNLLKRAPFIKPLIHQVSHFISEWKFSFISPMCRPLGLIYEGIPNSRQRLT